MLLILLLLALMQSPPPQEVPDLYEVSVPPPQRYPHQGRIVPSEHQQYSLRGAISVSTVEKQISIKWMFERDGSTVFAYQNINVPYWPTAAAFVDGSLIVAGKRRNLKTRIERWDFDYPAIPATGSDYDPTHTTQVLFDEDTVGKRWVRFLNPVLSSAGNQSVLVHFGDSNDVYQLNLATLTLTLVVSHTSVPELARSEWQLIWAGEHPTEGYVYVYSFDPNSAHGEPPVLFDRDKDGVIEDAAALSDAEWSAALGNPTPWIKIYDG